MRNAAGGRGRRKQSRSQKQQEQQEKAKPVRHRLWRGPTKRQDRQQALCLEGPNRPRDRGPVRARPRARPRRVRNHVLVYGQRNS